MIMVRYTLLELAALLWHKIRARSYKKKVAAIPAFEFEEGLAELRKRIEELSKKHATVILAVSGESGSGKTSASRKIAERLGGVFFSIDDYSKIGAKRIDWDRPRGYYLRLLKQHLKYLRQGKTIKKPAYSFREGRQTGFVEFLPARLVIVEGLHALHRKLSRLTHLRIYVETADNQRIERLVQRYKTEKGHSADVVKEHLKHQVDPLAIVHVIPTKSRAHLIIRT